ncbi:MAG: hypothetical protein AAFO07_29695 [Bacteroidota bacterium]
MVFSNLLTHQFFKYYKCVLIAGCSLFYNLTSYGQTPFECNVPITTTELVTNYIIPDNVDQITFTIKGGDGGNTKLGTSFLQMLKIIF